MNHGLTQAIVRLLDQEMRKPRKGSTGVVYLSPVLLWIGIVCTAIFLIPGLFVPLHTGDWSMGWFFLVMAVLSSTLIVAYINCRIWYTEESFTVRYFWGFRRTFSYGEIESVQGKQRDVKLKVRRCTVRVDEFAVGRKEFLNVARKQYRIATGGKAIPVAQKPKWDIFNGHVENSGEFLAVYITLCLFMPVLTAVLWFVVEPTPMEDLTIVTGQVEVIAVDERNLVIRAGGEAMEIRGYEKTLADTQAFLDASEQGAVFKIGYRIVTNDEDEITGFCAEYIQDSGGKVWITPQGAKEYRFESTAGVFALVELMLLAYCGASIYVGRNPHKFSKKVIRQFFKDGYVH